MQTTNVFVQRVQVSYAQESYPEALVSRKLVFREGCSEGSESTKFGTDERKRRMGYKFRISKHII